MENQELFNLIDEFIQENKPKNIHKLLLDISKPYSSVDVIRIKPHYVIDVDSGLLNPVYNSSNFNWYTEGDVLYDKFESQMDKLIRKYFSVIIYFGDRSVTEKDYWYKTYNK